MKFPTWALCALLLVGILLALGAPRCAAVVFGLVVFLLLLQRFGT